MSQFEELEEPDEMDRTELSRERFLASHRAIAVCAREFGRLAEELADRASTLCNELAIAEPPEMRQTPGRCIVQMGPIAVTTAWLRGPLDSLADGRLMAIAWHGTIVRRGFRERPERNDTSAVTWEPDERRSLVGARARVAFVDEDDALFKYGLQDTCSQVFLDGKGSRGFPGRKSTQLMPEASWRWKSEVDAARYASGELAALLMDQARAAWQQRKTA